MSGEISNIPNHIISCNNKDCEFCCLNNYECGKKKQCENLNYYIKYVNGVFIFIVSVLILVFIIKCFQVDGCPVEDIDDKLKADSL